MPPLDRYTCEDVFRRMDDFVDRELAPGEVVLVHTHLETCAACASEYAFEENVLSTVREKLRRIAVPSELRDRIALKLAAARSSRTSES